MNYSLRTCDMNRIKEFVIFHRNLYEKTWWKKSAFYIPVLLDCEKLPPLERLHFFSLAIKIYWRVSLLFFSFLCFCFLFFALIHCECEIAAEFSPFAFFKWGVFSKLFAFDCCKIEFPFCFVLFLRFFFRVLNFSFSSFYQKIWVGAFIVFFVFCFLLLLFIILLTSYHLF